MAVAEIVQEADKTNPTENMATTSRELTRREKYLADETARTERRDLLDPVTGEPIPSAPLWKGRRDEGLRRPAGSEHNLFPRQQTPGSPEKLITGNEISRAVAATLGPDQIALARTKDGEIVLLSGSPDAANNVSVKKLVPTFDRHNPLSTVPNNPLNSIIVFEQRLKMPKSDANGTETRYTVVQNLSKESIPLLPEDWIKDESGIYRGPIPIENQEARDAKIQTIQKALLDTQFGALQTTNRDTEMHPLEGGNVYTPTHSPDTSINSGMEQRPDTNLQTQEVIEQTPLINNDPKALLDNPSDVLPPSHRDTEIHPIEDGNVYKPTDSLDTTTNSEREQTSNGDLQAQEVTEQTALAETVSNSSKDTNEEIPRGVLWGGPAREPWLSPKKRKALEAERQRQEDEQKIADQQTQPSSQNETVATQTNIATEHGNEGITPRRRRRQTQPKNTITDPTNTANEQVITINGRPIENGVLSLSDTFPLRNPLHNNTAPTSQQTDSENNHRQSGTPTAEKTSPVTSEEIPEPYKPMFKQVGLPAPHGARNREAQIAAAIYNGNSPKITDGSIEPPPTVKTPEKKLEEDKKRKNRIKATADAFTRKLRMIIPLGIVGGSLLGGIGYLESHQHIPHPITQTENRLDPPSLGQAADTVDITTSNGEPATTDETVLKGDSITDIVDRQIIQADSHISDEKRAELDEILKNYDVKLNHLTVDNSGLEHYLYVGEKIKTLDKAAIQYLVGLYEKGPGEHASPEERNAYTLMKENLALKTGSDVGKDEKVTDLTNAVDALLQTHGLYTTQPVRVISWQANHPDVK